MLLSLWADFWKTTDWVQGPPPPVVVPTPNSGGHGRKRRDREYYGADDEYWELYAESLRRHQQTPEVPETAPEPVKALAISRKRLVREFVEAKFPSIDDLRAFDAKIDALTSEIDKFSLKSDGDEEAILALIL